jgi:membrane-bound lytic murein transglycosylase B
MTKRSGLLAVVLCCALPALAQETPSPQTSMQLALVQPAPEAAPAPSPEIPPATAAAPDTLAEDLAATAAFAQCLTRLQERARAEGLAPNLVDELMPTLKPHARVLGFDRAQPEFMQTLASYLTRRVTAERVERGRQLRAEYQAFLADLTRRYGVPGHYLLAFWGMETNFGTYLGKMPVLDSLATLACDQRRSQFFSDELLTALKLLQREGLDPNAMLGSWAGAMGHTQFMPSAYAQFAVDGDADRRVDLWRSERDALASGANYLQHLGWQKGERWGREVLLPEDFPFAQASLGNKQSMRHWRELGVRLPTGEPLPALDMKAALLIPSGHAGPAFLVYQNFHVIMRWNRSESYALGVGLLADRIAGAGLALARPPVTDEPPVSRMTIATVQTRLNLLGYAAGEVDGVMGPATRSALRAFEEDSGFIADGYPDSKTLGALALNDEPSS